MILAGCALGPQGTQGVAGFAKGVITAKGSIYVNGVEYDDASAAITVDDTANHTDSELKVGMVVEVKGTIDSATGKGTATEINYAADLEGTVDSGSIDLVAGTFSVFGQSIATDATTVFEGIADLTALASGDRVEVSGMADAVAQVIHATRVEKKTTTEDYRIKGVVSNLTATSFDLTTEHAAAAITVDFTGTLAAGITNGSFVLVKFVSYATPISTTAAQVKLLEHLEASSGDRVEASGVISGFAAGVTAATFTVNGIDVQADNTLIAGLSLADGVKVEVKGTMSSGVLVAEKIQAERESNIEATGTVDSSAVDAASGTFSLDGILFTVTSSTIFRDESAANVEHFSLADLATGDPLKVNAYLDGTGKLIASKVERAEHAVQTSLQAPVSAKATDQLTMLGLTVDISGITFAPDQAAFLASITLNSTVIKVRGSVSGSTFTATQASIDD
jgi:hypothetical protein